MMPHIFSYYPHSFELYSRIYNSLRLQNAKMASLDISSLTSVSFQAILCLQVFVASTETMEFQRGMNEAFLHTFPPRLKGASELQVPLESWPMLTNVPWKGLEVWQPNLLCP